LDGSWRRGAAIVVAVGLSACHGNTVRQPHVPNHPGDFDLRRPPCEAAPRPDAHQSDLLVRYLGVGGLYLEWAGVSLLTAPLFTRYGALRVAFGEVAWDEDAIRRGLDGLPLETTHALLVGHAHYDHLADVPPVLINHATGALVYVNRTGARMLEAFPELSPRVVVLEELGDDWIRLVDRDGAGLPFRMLALPYAHAPHLWGIHFAEGEIEESWDDWSDRKLRKMKEGSTFAFVIDLMSDDDTVLYRIHYQDAVGLPSRFPDERPVDLAMLPAASHQSVEGYPETVIRETGARHVMVIHYEDFLRESGKPMRMVPTLTDKKARRFLEAVESETAPWEALLVGPEPCGCGPCGGAWSMPLPGEWLRFRVQREP
jgi:hypothetical protein